MRIVQITPRFAPAICGVGDYTRLLGDALQKEHGITTLYISSEFSARTAEHSNNVVMLKRRTATSLTNIFQSQALKPDAIVLQYSGYGFAHRGAPLWLANALSELRKSPNCPLILTMFHELYATGPWHTAAFWWSWLQRRTVVRIAEASHCIRTNRNQSKEWLSQNTMHSREKIGCLPVFSNLGELAGAKKFNDADPTMILPFAGDMKSRELWNNVRQATKSLKCSSVVVTGAGARADSIPDLKLDGLSPKIAGPMSSEDYSRLLSNVDFGFINYPPSYLGKSGLWAALAAHGVPAILADADENPGDGLVRGKHFLTNADLEGQGIPIDGLRAMSHATRMWYSGHSIRETARAFYVSLTEAFESAVSNKGCTVLR